MKITDLKCAVIGNSPVVRILTDEGLYGHGQIEESKPYVKPQVLFYRDLILGQDPTDVERVMLNIQLQFFYCFIARSKSNFNFSELRLMVTTPLPYLEYRYGLSKTLG